jgi:hypothetical protein
MGTALRLAAWQPEKDCAIDKCCRLGYDRDSESVVAAKRSTPLAPTRQRLMPTGVVTVKDRSTAHRLC